MLDKFKKLVGIGALAGAASLNHVPSTDALAVAETKYYEVNQGNGMATSEDMGTLLSAVKKMF